jgi:DNA-directed RNA polymerase specialized sigma24 family protein/CheY-like chemotaxis protein
MTIASAIAAHVPYLRRFARALTGTQASGDAYVAATLEAAMEGTAAGAPPPTRLALYRTFLRIWGSIPLNRGGTADPENALMRTAHSRLEAITPLPRVAFLLNALEGFGTEEIAEIMARSPGDIQALLGLASSEIAAHLSTGVLIIEDEPIIAMDLEAVVTSLGHRVLQIARTRREAVAAMADHRPGLVLADIQLADGSNGLDAVKEILAVCSVPVVFITAYPERLLTGSRPEPTFLITKPFRTEAVKAIITQALFFDRRATLAATPSAIA